MIENVGSELKKYFEGKSMLAALLGFDIIIFFGTIAIYALELVFYLGGIINGLLLYVFLLGIILVLANLNFNMLFIGLGARAAIALIDFFITLFRQYGFFYWGGLFTTAIFGFLAYLAYKKTQNK